MNCEQAREQIILSEYDGLDPEQRGPLQAHVDQCANCQQFQGQVVHTQQALDQWEPIEQPVDLAELYESVQFGSQAPYRSTRHGWLPWFLRAGIACAVLVIGLLAWIGLDARWQDSGLTLRFGPEEPIKLPQTEVVHLLQLQQQMMQAGLNSQLREALTEWNEEFLAYLDERERRTEAQLLMLYQAVQAQRSQDLASVDEALQDLAGATEAELREAGRLVEFILASQAN